MKLNKAAGIDGILIEARRKSFKEKINRLDEDDMEEGKDTARMEEEHNSAYIREKNRMR